MIPWVLVQVPLTSLHFSVLLLVFFYVKLISLQYMRSEGPQGFRIFSLIDECTLIFVFLKSKATLRSLKDESENCVTQMHYNYTSRKTRLLQ